MNKRLLVIFFICLLVLIPGCGNKKKEENKEPEQVLEQEKTFDEKLKELTDSKATDSEIADLFWEYIDIKTKKINEWYYLVEITNNTPYDLSKITIVWDPIKDGVSKYNSSKTVDRTTSFYYIYSGETVYDVQYFTNYDSSEEKGYAINPDEIVIVSKTFKNYYETTENSYKDIILTDLRYDQEKGIIYTIENKSDKKLYPNIDIIFYKDGEIVYVENRTQYYLNGNTKLDNYEFSKSSDGSYRKYDFEFDEIKAFINDSKE